MNQLQWFYRWRYKRHRLKAVKYTNKKLYPTLFEYHIEKMRYYSEKQGWDFQ